MLEVNVTAVPQVAAGVAGEIVRVVGKAITVVVIVLLTADVQPVDVFLILNE